MLEKKKHNDLTFDQSEIDGLSVEYMAIASSKRNAWQEQRINGLIGQFESIGANAYPSREEKIYVIDSPWILYRHRFENWVKTQNKNFS